MTYKCSTCGINGVKLWRLYNAVLSAQTLECFECACKSQGVASQCVRGDGIIWNSDIQQWTDSIGWRVPAVPTDDGTFWGYTSIPKSGVEWWKKLPLREAR